MKRFFRNKKTRFIFATLVVAFFICIPLVTFAEVTSPSSPAPGWFGTEILAAVTGVFNRLLALAGAFAMMLTSWILWASGSLLTEVLKYTVLNMSQNINSISAINVAWTVFRDLANMFFIFILLYAAIGTILGLSGVNAKKMVVNIVIIALLINFSLFFTKIIIDASNIVTIGFYNRITSSIGENGGLATPFMNKMGIVGMFSIDGIMSDSGALSSNKTLTEIALTGIMGSIFILVTAFVFFAANIMFIGRFVILIFLMILSPLAFAAMALPKDKYSSDWWKSLLDQALFAPAFLAMMYATLLIVEGLNIPNAGFAKVFVPGEDGKAPDLAMVQVLMNYIIIIVMIIACLIIAKKFGAHGSGEMIKRGQKLRGWAQGKVGRGALRGTGLAALDRKFADSDFAKTRTGNIFRSMTTGAITNAKFGSDTSIQKVDKANKDLDKKYNEGVMKGVEKKFEKSLPEQRKNYIGDLNKKIDESGTKKFETEAQLMTKREELEDAIANGKAVRPERELPKLEREITEREGQLRRASSGGLAIPKSEIDRVNTEIAERREKVRVTKEIQKQIENLKKESDTTQKEISSFEQEKKTTQSNMDGGFVATKSEKGRWLNQAYEEKAKSLESLGPTLEAGKKMFPGTSRVIGALGKLRPTYLDFEMGLTAKKDVVKELRKKTQGGGKEKDIINQLKESLKNAGELEDGGEKK